MKQPILDKFFLPSKTVFEEIRAIENIRKLSKAEHMESTALLKVKLKEYTQIKSDKRG